MTAYHCSCRARGLGALPVTVTPMTCPPGYNTVTGGGFTWSKYAAWKLCELETTASNMIGEFWDWVRNEISNLWKDLQRIWYWSQIHIVNPLGNFIDDMLRDFFEGVQSLENAMKNWFKNPLIDLGLIAMAALFAFGAWETRK